MGKFKPKSPDTSKQDALQADQMAKAKQNEQRSNEQLSSAARFATKRRTGRRLLLAPGREDELANLGGGQGSTGGNY
jgi:hypothetical protein